MSNSNFEIGKHGEYITAAALHKLGEKCEIINLGTVDIAVDKQEAGLVRLQVKSSHYKPKDRRPARGYQFFTAFGLKKQPLTKEHCDVVAFVALDIERVIFKPIGQIAGQVTKRFARSKFNKKNLEQDTWAVSLEEVLP